MDLTEAYDLFESNNTDVLAYNTLKAYRSTVRAFTRLGFSRTEDFTRSALAAWVTKRRAEGAIPRSINAQLAAILAVLSWLEKAGHFELETLLGLRRLRFRRLVTPTPVFLTVEEILRLRYWALTISRRFDLMVCFAIFAGMRKDEIRRLKREDLVLEAEEPFLRVGLPTKSKKPRSTPLTREFADWLLAWGLPTSGFLFPKQTSSCKTEHVGKNSLHHWLVEARTRAGLPHVTWYILRHTFASQLRSRGLEISLISGFMGNTVRVCEQHYAALAPGGNPLIEKGFAAIWAAVKRPADAV